MKRILWLRIESRKSIWIGRAVLWRVRSSPIVRSPIYGASTVYEMANAPQWLSIWAHAQRAGADLTFFSWVHATARVIQASIRPEAVQSRHGLFANTFLPAIPSVLDRISRPLFFFFRTSVGLWQRMMLLLRMRVDLHIRFRFDVFTRWRYDQGFRFHFRNVRVRGLGRFFAFPLLFSLLCPPVLEPDLDLSFTEAYGSGEFCLPLYRYVLAV